MGAKIVKGDYVLATKWGDGDPNDQWCIGLYDREEDGRHYVVDADGKQFRRNGFRRVKKITKERGDYILANKPTVEAGVRSLWWWARTKIV